MASSSGSGPEWDGISKYLRTSLPAGTASWIDELGTSTQGRRLGASLAIDIKHGALKESLIDEVLGSLSGDSDATVSFTDGLNASGLRHQYLCQSELSAPALDGGRRYVRILEIGQFTEHYGKPFGLSLNVADVNRMRHMFLTQKPGVLSAIRVPWRGALENAWVTSDDQVNELKSQSSQGSLGTRLNNALGFGLDDGWSPNLLPDFVGVVYPSDFDGPCVQPTTFDVNWDVAHQYVSYVKLDGWGRTASCDGIVSGCLERVHSTLPDGLPAEFHALYVGESDPVTIDDAQLLKQAYERFDFDDHAISPGAST
jgi:hypothetical protein